MGHAIVCQTVFVGLSALPGWIQAEIQLGSIILEKRGKGNPSKEGLHWSARLLFNGLLPIAVNAVEYLIQQKLCEGKHKLTSTGLSH